MLLSFPLSMVEHFKVLIALIERSNLLLSCFEPFSPHFYNIKMQRKIAELDLFHQRSVKTLQHYF